MLELKMYQLNVLDHFSRYLDALKEARNASETALEALKQAGVDSPDEIRNYPQKAWQKLKDSGYVAEEYVNRTDDANRPIPHLCFKVPTGGGKTFLATAALERLHRQTGLTLWIVPSKAILHWRGLARFSAKSTRFQVIVILIFF